LASITGAASSLLEAEDAIGAAARRELAQTIHEEATRLNRLLRNLLDMTRLESGAVKLNKEWQPLEEVLGAALTRLDEQLAGREVRSRLPPDLPFVAFDSVLLEQVLINLLAHLTPIEYKLLAMLAKHAGKVLTHQQLLKEVWGQAFVHENHNLRVHIAQLRRKIEQDAARPRYLFAEPGVGYRLRAD
jgi:two-component system sensor histidine kinase KdpD